MYVIEYFEIEYMIELYLLYSITSIPNSPNNNPKILAILIIAARTNAHWYSLHMFSLN